MITFEQLLSTPYNIQRYCNLFTLRSLRGLNKQCCKLIAPHLNYCRTKLQRAILIYHELVLIQPRELYYFINGAEFIKDKLLYHLIRAYIERTKDVYKPVNIDFTVQLLNKLWYYNRKEL